MKRTRYGLALSLLATAALGLGLLSVAGCERKSQSGPVASASPSANEVAAARETSGGQALSVQTVVPTRKDLTVKFEQSGPVEAVAQADLYTHVTGYVKKVNVDIGDEVKEGQVLLEVDVPELNEELQYKDALVRQAEAEHEQAEAAVQAAEAALEIHPTQVEQAVAEKKKVEAEKHFREQQVSRYSRLAAKDATTVELAEEKREQLGAAAAAYDSSLAKEAAVKAEEAVLKAKLAAATSDEHAKAAKVDVAKSDRERTRAMIEFSRLRAPFDGVITRRNFFEGAFLNSAASGHGEPIFTIARIDRLLAVMSVPPEEAVAVRVGCRAFLRLDSHEIEGTVARFAHSLEKTRTMRVEIEVDNASHSLYPGMFGSCELILKEIPNALTVPASAIYAREGQSFVIKAQEGKAHRIPVKTGYDDGHVVAVLGGLQGDEEIVVSNKGQIAEGQALDAHRVDNPTPSEVAKSSDTSQRAN